MQTDEEIQDAVAAAWSGHIDSVTARLKKSFQSAVNERGLCAYDGAGLPPGRNYLMMPNFAATEEFINQEQYQAALKSLPAHLSEPYLRQIIHDIFTERPVKYEAFLSGNGFYFQIRLARNDIEQQRNDVFKNLPKQIKQLENLIAKTVIKSCKAALQQALDNMSYTLKYHDMLLNHIDRWFSRYGIDSTKKGKQATKEPCWDGLILTAYLRLTGVSENHTQACYCTAKLLAVMYPDIWCAKSLHLTSEAIRQRLYPDYPK